MTEDCLTVRDRVLRDFNDRAPVLVEFCDIWYRGEVLLNHGPHPALFLEEVGLIWLHEERTSVTAVEPDTGERLEV